MEAPTMCVTCDLPLNHYDPQRQDQLRALGKLYLQTCSKECTNAMRAGSLAQARIRQRHIDAHQRLVSMDGKDSDSMWARSRARLRGDPVYVDVLGIVRNTSDNTPTGQVLSPDEMDQAAVNRATEIANAASSDVRVTN